MNILRFWKPALWLLFIITASLFPGNRLPGVPLFPFADKAIHFFLYFVLALLMVKPVAASIRNMSWLWVILIGLTVGGAVEILQEVACFHRSGSSADQFANMAGTITGTLLCIVLRKYPALYRWL